MLPESPQTRGVPWQVPSNLSTWVKDQLSGVQRLQGHLPPDRHGFSRQRGKGRAVVGRGDSGVPLPWAPSQ